MKGRKTGTGSESVAGTGTLRCYARSYRRDSITLIETKAVTEPKEEIESIRSY